MEEQEKKYSIPADTDAVMAHEPAVHSAMQQDLSPEAVVARIKARVRSSMKVSNIPFSTITLSFGAKMREIYQKATNTSAVRDLSSDFSCIYLLDKALSYASKHNGLWLNVKENTYPVTEQNRQEFTHYGAVLASLYSQERGYSTNVFCGIEALDRMKISIKDTEKERPIEIPMLDMFGSRTKMLYNIDQTTMSADSPRHYARLRASYSSEAKPEELYLHKSFEVFKREKEDPALRMFRIGESYVMFGEHAVTAGKILGKDTIYNRKIGVLTLTVPTREMEQSVASLSSAARKITLHDAKGLFTTDGPDKLYDMLLPFVKDRAERFGARLEPVYHSRSRYDVTSNTLYLRGLSALSSPKSPSDKEQEATSLLRALADMSRKRIGRETLGLDNLLPADAERYGALLTELAVGSQLLLRNRPARISEENMHLIAYWRQELRENPGMKDIIEKGVNYIHDMMTENTIRRYSRDMSISGVVDKNPPVLTITEDLGGHPDINKKTAVIIRDPRKNYADVLIPSGASPYALEEISGMEKDTFISALRKEGIREVNFFNTDGYCAIRYPNLYYDDKKIEIVTVRDGKIVSSARVDVKDEIERTSRVQIESMGLLKNFNGRLEMYIIPKDGKPLSIEPSYNDIQEYFKAVRMPDKDAVMEKKKEIALKYYYKALRNPVLQTDLLSPRTDGIDASRISHVNIVKNEDMTYVIHAKIDGEHHQKPITFDQYQRLWLVTDKEAYKQALSARVFENELGHNEEKDESLEIEVKTTEEKKPEPAASRSEVLDGQDNTPTDDISQDDKKETRRGGHGR